jgi:chromosome segregation ATPase
MNLKRSLGAESGRLHAELERSRTWLGRLSLHLADAKQWNVKIPGVAEKMAAAQREYDNQLEKISRLERECRELDEKFRIEKLRLRSRTPHEVLVEQVADLEEDVHEAADVLAKLRGDREEVLVRGARADNSELDDVDRRILDASRLHESLDARLAVLRGKLPPTSSAPKTTKRSANASV